jgi:hypothetical protein
VTSLKFPEAEATVSIGLGRVKGTNFQGTAARTRERASVAWGRVRGFEARARSVTELSSTFLFDR